METSHVNKVGGVTYKTALKHVYLSRIKNQKVSIKDVFAQAMAEFDKNHQ